MKKTALVVTTLLLGAHSQAQPLFGRLASTPVQPFNQQIQQAGAHHQAWVNDYREVALRFINRAHLPSQIQARQVDNHLILSVSLAEAQSDTLYLLTLYRHNDLWQMRNAELGWRCPGEQAFAPIPCANSGRIH